MLHALWLSGSRNAWVMMAMQIALVLSYAGLAWGLLRGIRDSAQRELHQGAMTLTAD